MENPGQVHSSPRPTYLYQIRHSNRAKYMRINASPETGIEVVVPKHMDLKHIEPFVRQHKDWIAHQVEKLKLNQPTALPEYVNLRMLNKLWQVHYKITEGPVYQLRQSHNILTISGPDRNLNICREKLHRWLRQQAKQHLPKQLNRLSQKTGLSYNKVSIRTQRTRWGSCSSSGNINLNDRLVLLPREQVDYVMIHELCHTQHMNHSVQFWKLLESHIPNYESCRKQLREAKQYLPKWIYSTDITFNNIS